MGRTSTPSKRVSAVSTPVMAAALVAAALGVAAHVMGKAVRDALFLATFPVEWLPYAFVATAVISGVAISLYTELSARLSTRWVVPGLAALCALVYPLLYLLVREPSGWSVALVYGWVSVSGGLVVSGFWTLLSERFEPRAARRLYGVVGAASTVGGLSAGIGSHELLSVTDTEGLLLPLAVVNLLLAGALFQLGVKRVERSTPQAAAPAGLMGGVRNLAGEKYLRNVAFLVTAITIAGTLGDYVMKDRAVATLTDKRALAEFFSLFHGAVGAVTLAVQVVFVRPMVARRGLSAALLALPAWLAVGAGLVLGSPGLVAATALRGGENAVRNSFHRSGYELLFIPLDAATKRVVKPILDTLLERIADGLGALSVLFVVGVLGLSSGSLGWLVLGLGGWAVYLVLQVRTGYVETLSKNLVARAVELDDVALAVDDDATAREAIRTTLVDARRGDLLAELQKSRVGASLMQSLHLDALPVGITALRKSIKAARTTPRRAVDPPVTDPVVAQITEMLSPDPAVATAAIRRWDGRDRRPVPVLIRLLARQDLHEVVTEVLAKSADRIAGSLADHLGDSSESFAVRRRLPRVLAHSHSDTAVQALTSALADPRFEVRYHAAAALARIRRESESTLLASEAVWTAVREELKKSRPMWEAQRVLDSPHDRDEAEMLGRLKRRGAYSLHHVFRLLGLVLDPKPMELSYRAVQADDPLFRGVGLEYLENVLPEDVRTALWPHIGDDDAPPVSRRGRSLSDVMAELSASGSAVLPRVDRDDLETGGT